MRALAFAIKAKSVCAPSAFKDWSYARLSKAVGCSENTARKRIAMLFEMGLVESSQEKGHSYLFFKRLRSAKVHTRYRGLRYPKNKDVVVEKIDTSSLKSIETGLMALLIVEIERQKNWYKHQPIRARGGSRVRLSRKANPYFVDYGISRKTITHRLHCSETTLENVIKYGENQEMFICKRGKRHEMEVERGFARQAMEFSNEIAKNWHFAMNSRLCRVETNHYQVI